MPQGKTPDDVWPSLFVTRVEWEEAERMRHSQKAVDLSQQCQDRETLNEVRADVKTLVAWMNQQKGVEESRAQTIKDFKAVKEWVDGMKKTAMNTGKIAAYMVGLATFWKFVVVPIIFHGPKGGIAP